MKYVLFMLTVLSALSLNVLAQDKSKSSKEYDIKAAFLHKFMVFTDWPQEKLPENDEPFILAIIGNDPFGNAFDPLKNELVKGRKVVIKRLNGFTQSTESDKAHLDELKQAVIESHLLFICQSEEKSVKNILQMATGQTILTVSDIPGFVEYGGMIGLSVEETKIRFEINNVVASQAGLKISSQLLRLAKKVIQDDSSKSGDK